MSSRPGRLGSYITDHVTNTPTTAIKMDALKYKISLGRLARIMHDASISVT